MNKLVLIGILALVAVAGVIGGASIFSMTQDMGNGLETALVAQNPEDPCATPEGYTDKDWTEHMSHHPEKYEGCL